MQQKFMDYAFKMAKIAYDNGEVPVGAVIVKDNSIISYAYNYKEHDRCCISHAEILAIKEASKILGNWRLDGCELYVTLDPCPMCASAIKQSRISRVYSALSNSDDNNYKIITDIFKTDNTNASVSFITNVSVDKSKILLNKFFKEQRTN